MLVNAFGNDKNLKTLERRNLSYCCSNCQICFYNCQNANTKEVLIVGSSSKVITLCNHCNFEKVDKDAKVKESIHVINF